MEQFYLHLLVLLVLSILLRFLIAPGHAPEEPPLVSSRIPFIGHLIGLARYGNRYYVRLSAQSQLPAITINIFRQKIYLIYSPGLLAAAQRHAKYISFEPFAALAIRRAAGIKGNGPIVSSSSEKGRSSFDKQMKDAVHSVLLGEAMVGITRASVAAIKKSVDDLRSTEVDLLTWCRHVLTMATTDSIYGPMNPYRNREAEAAIWEFDSGLGKLTLNFAQRFIAREAYQAREKLVKRLLEYFEKCGYINASSFVQRRLEVERKAGATLEDIARLETLMVLPLLSNSAPSTFWVLFDIFSRLDLLEEIRKEIVQNALQFKPCDDSMGKPKQMCTLNMNNIRDKCPLLVATWQETLRLRANTASVRFVSKDTKLNDTYLLKANSIVQTPANVLNVDPNIWGPDAHLYNPRRFLDTRASPGAGGDRKRDRKWNGFMTFGASPWTCPGRHFATAQILALVSLLVMKFDISPVAGDWVSPRINHRSMALAISIPAEGLMVNVVTRKEVKGIDWEFQMMEGKGKFGLIVG
ncbi:cytochrome P450 oxidoreductase [Coccidioides immitis RS]|uniref:Cytochrome P450 oxidoreductase n=1 Tax=Coccidioides immitis (strain RS) TaxID=246410 RepID=A0A0E1S5J5_COCIM|nr:cytochrome P450 oxidoreductase [Coccidioides immitis RS]EAS37010.2 cytochrome P450 oxidoreductase [Coccidioides immitis RS]TPX24956.1 hypothetical protein DIZ76_010405 [Coccidioides immitis]